MTIVDSHAHIGILENSRFAESFEKNLAMILEEMKTANIAHACLIAGYDKVGMADPTTQRLLQLTEHADAVSVIGSIDILHYKDHDLDELDRWLKTKKIVGIKLYLGYQPFFPDNKRCYPVYELCRKHGAPVVFHTGDTLNNFNIRGRVKYAHPLGVDDVAVDFPDLKIIIAHMGNPWLSDCAELLYKNDNVYADMSGIVAGESLEDSYGELMKRRIRELIDYSSEEKLLFGTDWPLARYGQYISFVRSLGISDAGLEKVFSGNARELFKLNL